MLFHSFNFTFLAFGKVLLHTIGYIYRRQAARQIGKGKRYMKVPFLAEWVRDKRHTRNTQSAAAQGANTHQLQVSHFSSFLYYMMSSSSCSPLSVSAAIAYIHLREEWKKCNEEQVKNEKTLKTAENIKDAIFVSFWQMNVVDIETTLSHVSQAVSFLPSLYVETIPNSQIWILSLS